MRAVEAWPCAIRAHTLHTNGSKSACVCRDGDSIDERLEMDTSGLYHLYWSNCDEKRRPVSFHV